METFQFSPAKNFVFLEMTATKKSISYWTPGYLDQI